MLKSTVLLTENHDLGSLVVGVSVGSRVVGRHNGIICTVTEAQRR